MDSRRIDVFAAEVIFTPVIASAFSDFLNDPKVWIALGSLVVSIYAAINSRHSRKISARALALNEKQEVRRQPELRVSLVTGYRQRLSQKQLFAFLISVANPTDANNSVALAELQVGYLIENNFQTTCRVPHNHELEEANSAGKPKPNVFHLPLKVDAHQTASGWLLFQLDDSVFGGRTIDSHKIILEDSHGKVTMSEPIAVREWVNEDQTN